MPIKQYGSPEEYEDKLKRVMERFQADEYDFDWNRKGNCWIRFTIGGEPFYFSHSVDAARDRGINLRYGSDAFAQLVLTLEDLARANERGTFHLKKVLGAMIAIEPPKEFPNCFVALEFDNVPENFIDVTVRYQKLMKANHPDKVLPKQKELATQKFIRIQQAYREADKYFDKGGRLTDEHSN